MDDSISRAAVLEVIRGYCPDEPKSKDLREYWEKRYEPLIKVREEIEKIPLSDGWIPCKERLPSDYQWYYATCKSLVDNRENWVVEGCYTPWEHFNSTPMIKCGEAEVIAWMPKEFPEPWKGEEK